MSGSIPQTAYLKLVDVWFVYCIISLFLVVVTVAFINWCRVSVLLVGCKGKRGGQWDVQPG